MDAVAWEMVRELLGVGKSHPRARRHPGREAQVRALVLEEVKAVRSMGLPPVPAAWFQAFTLEVNREGNTQIRS